MTRNKGGDAPPADVAAAATTDGSVTEGNRHDCRPAQVLVFKERQPFFVVPHLNVPVALLRDAVLADGGLEMIVRRDKKFGYRVTKPVGEFLLEGDEILQLHAKPLQFDTEDQLRSAIDDILRQKQDPCISVRLCRQRPTHAAGGATIDTATAATATNLPPVGSQVAVAISKGAFLNGLGKAKRDDEACAQGRWLWPESRFQATSEQAVAGGLDNAELLLAHTTQVHLRSVGQTTKDINATLGVVDATMTRTQRILTAISLALAAVSSVLFLHQHPGRVAHALQAKRNASRTMDRTVNACVNFASRAAAAGCVADAVVGADDAMDVDVDDNDNDDTTDSAAAAAAVDDDDDDVPRGRLWFAVAHKFALPLIVVGDYATQRKKRGSKFPFAVFLKKLARRCIVLIVSEHRTTMNCTFCGCPVQYTDKQDGSKHSGTVLCGNLVCMSRQLFSNRDLHAGVNIGLRTWAGLLVGGTLGWWF
jgi:hypothetical protein